MRVGFVGLGRLGYPCALASASKGHQVMGYDISVDTLAAIKTGNLKYKEQAVHDLRKQFSIEIIPLHELVRQSEIVFVAIQTPHSPQFEGVTRLPNRRVDFNYDYLIDGIKSINEIAEEIEQDVIVAVISTMLPGTMQSKIMPHAGARIKFVYNPFFIAQGTTVKDYLEPEFVLLGVDDDHAAEIVAGYYVETTDAPIRRMSIASAECTKVLYNTLITSKIRHANDAARLCHEIPGSNVDDVTMALQAATDRIVSPRYMTAGMEDGGGCHPRDNIALSAIARKHGWEYDPWGRMMEERDGYTEWLAWKCIETGMDIVILGTAFKPEVDLCTGSPALLLASILTQFGHEPELIDPVLSEDTLELRPACYVIGCKHAIFANYKFPKGSVVIDPHRYIPDLEGITVIRIGESGKCYARS